MIHWDEESIQFMRDSAEHLRFADEQARHILPYLPPDAEICEGGCGLGYLSLALSPYAKHITAVEKSSEALMVLWQNLQRDEIPNITAVAADIFTMQPKRRYDAMVFCRFGAVEEILRLAVEQCAGTVVVLTLANACHRFTLTEKTARRKEWFSREKLEELKIPVQSEHFSVEMGQPLRSLADAVRFFQIYDRSGETVTEKQVKDRLTADPKGVYPFFSPMTSEFRLLAFQADDVRQSMTGTAK